MSMTHRSYFNQLSATWPIAHEGDEEIYAHLQTFGIADRDRVLDIGCGPGRLACLLTKMIGPEGLLVEADFAEGMLKVARSQQRPGTYICTDVCHLAFRANTFDKIVCFSTFPHIQAPLDALREMHRILKPGGRLLILHTCCSRRLNAFHSQLNGVVAADQLPRAHELKVMMQQTAFKSVKVIENPQVYWVEAAKPDDQEHSN